MNWLKERLGLNDFYKSFDNLRLDVMDLNCRFAQMENLINVMNEQKVTNRNIKDDLDENMKRANFMMLELKGLVSQMRATVNVKVKKK